MKLMIQMNVFALCLIVAFGCHASFGEGLMSDSELKSLYFSKKEDFWRLKDLMRSNGIYFVSKESVLPANNKLSPSEITVAKSILDEIGAISFGGASVNDPWFITYYEKSDGDKSGFSKGIAYQEGSVELSRNETLDVLQRFEYNIPEYLRIEGDWYIFAMNYDYPF